MAMLVSTPQLRRLLLLLPLLSCLLATAASLDVSESTVVTSPHASEDAAVVAEYLVHQAAHLHRVTWHSTDTTAAAVVEVIVDADGSSASSECRESLGSRCVPNGEAFCAWTVAHRRRVCLHAATRLGGVFAAGSLLRHVSWVNVDSNLPKLHIPDDWHQASAPMQSVRGHMISYRATANTYDAWTTEQAQQYVYDLAVFGTNMLELVAPEDPGNDPRCPLCRVPPLQMNQHLSLVAGRLGMRVSMWLPDMARERHADYSDPAFVRRRLAVWLQLAQALPHLDAIFAPSADPGNLEPKVLLAFLHAQAQNIRQHAHAHLEMWVSCQGWNSTYLDEFFLLLAQPDTQAWLSGVVYGPHTRIDLESVRRRVPASMPLRGYPDVSHQLKCQFPVPDYHLAYAMTQGREGINPRPYQHAWLALSSMRSTIGFSAYSDGALDDVNKVMWSGMLWTPTIDIDTLLQQYVRVFLSPKKHWVVVRLAAALARAAHVWSGRASRDAQACLDDVTLALSAEPELASRWRFQAMHFRAVYDVYVWQRWQRHQSLQRNAQSMLSQVIAAPAAEIPVILQHAKQLLQSTADLPTRERDLAQQVHALAAAMWHSIGYQSSVKMYGAANWNRGASLDTMDAPLSDAPYLIAFVDIVARYTDAEAQREAVLQELTRTQRAVYYHNFGAEDGEGERGDGWADDPQYLHHPLRDFHLWNPDRDPVVGSGQPLPPIDQITRFHDRVFADGLYMLPLHRRIPAFTCAAGTRAGVVVQHSVDAMAGRARYRLCGSADDGVTWIDVHGYENKPSSLRPTIHLLPWSLQHQAETAPLRLAWQRDAHDESTMNGRALQLSQVWIQCLEVQ